MRSTRNSISKFYLVISIACFLATSSLGKAQDLSPLPIEEALNVRSLDTFETIGTFTADILSPDGKWLAYVVKTDRLKNGDDPEPAIRTGVRLDFVQADVWVTNTETQKAVNLTNGKGANWLPSWSPDGRCLAFLSDRGGQGQAVLWIWDRATKVSRRVSEVKVRTDQLQWMPDGRHLVLTTVPVGLSVEEYVQKVLAKEDSPKDVVRRFPGSTVLLYESSKSTLEKGDGPVSDPWNLNEELRDLVSVNISNGEPQSLVTGRRIEWFQLSPDGARVAYTIPKRFERPGSQQILFDLAVTEISKAQTRVVAADIRLDWNGAEFSWSPDGELLSYHSGGMDETTKDCYVVSADGGQPKNITHMASSDSHYISSFPLWSDSKTLFVTQSGTLWRASVSQEKGVKVAEIPGREMLALVPRMGRSLWTVDKGKSTVVMTHDSARKQDGFYKVDLVSGAGTKLLENGQCYYTCTSIAGSAAEDGKKVFYVSQDAAHDLDVWSTDAEFSEPQRLTHVNPQFEKHKLGAAQLIDWRSDDGEPLQGALLVPPNYVKGKSVPLIVWVYGGDLLSNNLNWFGFNGHGLFNMQLFATRGYAVLLPDSPAHVATPMADLAKTVLPGVNKVIEMGIADPDRLAVMGQSNGGYSTLALIVQTKRFKAAIELDGMADLVGDYGRMDKSGSSFGTSSEHGQHALGGSPWEVREKYTENSPLFYFDRVETPLLIVHGSADDTVPSFLGDEVFVALRRLGKEVQYAKYEGEGHSQPYWSYANQADLYARMIAWLDKFMKPGQK